MRRFISVSWVTFYSLSVFVILYSLAAFSSADSESASLTKATSFPINVTGAIKSNFQIDLMTDQLGSIVSFHFFGDKADKSIPFEELRGKTVKGLFKIEALGDLLTLKGTADFDPVRGGEMTATYVSKWNVLTMQQKRSDFTVLMENQGGNWVIYSTNPDKSVGAELKGLELQVQGKGEKPAVGSIILVPQN